MADEKNICTRCRKDENSDEKFELVFDENAYFRHLICVRIATMSGRLRKLMMKQKEKDSVKN